MSDRTMVDAIKNKTNPRQQKAPRIGALSLNNCYNSVRYRNKVIIEFTMNHLIVRRPLVHDLYLVLLDQFVDWKLNRLFRFATLCLLNNNENSC